MNTKTERFAWLVKDPEFYKTFLILSLPIILQNVISLGVNLADNMMLGRYAEASLSGVTAVNQIQFVYQNLLLGAGEGIVVVASQYWGKRDTESIKKVGSIGMRISLIMMIALFVIVSLFPHWVVGLFSNDPAIVSEGVAYLGIIRFTYPFFCITTILLIILRSTQVVNIAFLLSLSTLCINCCINWVLIYGRFGLPAMGVRGAAIGTLTARIVEFVILLIFLKKKEKNLHLKISDFFHIDRQIAKDYFSVTWSLLIVQALWGINTAIQTAILGHLSSAAIAANSMASNLFLIVKTIAVGAASGTGVIIGKTIGLGDWVLLKRYAKTFQFLFLVMGVLCALILFALIEPVLSLYSFSDLSRHYARAFLHVLCIIMIGMSYQMPTNAGIIRAAGETRFVLKMDLVSIWCIVIPLSFIVAFVLDASPVIVVICLNLDQLFKGIPVFIKCNRGHWVHELTR